MAVLYIIGFILTFFVILASGLPVGFGLGLLALLILALLGPLDWAAAIGVDKAYISMDSDILVSIPLYILAAQLISASGMGKRLFDLASILLVKVRGGLGIATISSSGVFSAMTGSSFVSATTMGLIAIPELRRAGYSDRNIAAAITAGGTLGSVIPPSLVMIIYGYMTDESIGKLFLAGIVPGVLLIALYSLFFALMANKSGGRSMQSGLTAGAKSEVESTSMLDSQQIHGSDQMEHQASTFPTSKRTAFKNSVWGLMAPAIILGGIYLGVFTASEAAAVACFYCLFIGIFIYRTLSFSELVSVFQQTASTTAMVAVIVMGGAMLGHSVVLGGVPQAILSWIIEVDMQPWMLLLVINVILFALGMFLEVLAMIYLVVPLLMPVMAHMGWDGIWMGVIILINVNLALITPPLGGVLYVVAHIGNMPIGTVMRGAVMPIVVLLFVLAAVCFIPGLATSLPALM